MTHGRNKFISDYFIQKFAPQEKKITKHYMDIAYAARKN